MYFNTLIIQYFNSSIFSDSEAREVLVYIIINVQNHTKAQKYLSSVSHVGF